MRIAIAAGVLGTVLASGCEEDAGAQPSLHTAGDDSTGGESSNDETGMPTTAGVTSSVPTTTDPTAPTDPSNASNPTLPTDSSGDCQGCINAAGVCESGEFNTACGRGGVACEVCESPAECADGVCEDPPGCSPDNCDGCCDGDDCIGAPDESACGANGGECTTCEASATCTDAGICELPCEDTCIGCCLEGECIEDEEQDDFTCGFLGDTCEICNFDETCTFGLCVSDSCSSDCDGCCDGDTCLDGFDDDACGFLGQACLSCGADFECDGIDCAPQSGVQWQVVLLDGEVVSTDPNGAAWDAFNGNPDPFLSVPAFEFESNSNNDTLFPVWNQTITAAALTQELQEPLVFEMWDSDFDMHDLIGTCTIVLEDAAFGAVSDVSCDVSGDFVWEVTLSINTVQK